MSKLSTISRKILMALSGFFLMFFLLQHFTINILSIVNPDAFNEVSQFMGTNFLVQAVLQPVLMFGIIFHFVMAFILEIQNRKARPIGYFAASTSGGKKVSKNMIYSGIAILLFMGLHLYDFWVHEMIIKYGQGDMTGLNANGELRYYEELVHKFQDVWRVVIYVAAFVFLGLHTNHGFESSFQSVGANHPKYTPIIKKIGFFYSIVIPAGFAFIAIYHFLIH
ncbi:MAG: succinate dehydrogenase / fumarate reductase cytochrome b subunit [Chitinophagales bacterium]|jgi:succinate dehydrogenase / fumarate reductase cytochrome b subunit